MTQVRVPIAQLSAEGLAGLLQEFVSRDGTDYGAVEVSEERRAERLLHQLESGKAWLVFDTEIDDYAIISAENGKALLLD